MNEEKSKTVVEEDSVTDEKSQEKRHGNVFVEFLSAHPFFVAIFVVPAFTIIIERIAALLSFTLAAILFSIIITIAICGWVMRSRVKENGEVYEICITCIIIFFALFIIYKIFLVKFGQDQDAIGFLTSTSFKLFVVGLMVGLVVVIGLTYILSHSTISPLMELLFSARCRWLILFVLAAEGVYICVEVTGILLMGKSVIGGSVSFWIMFVSSLPIALQVIFYSIYYLRGKGGTRTNFVLLWFILLTLLCYLYYPHSFAQRTNRIFNLMGGSKVVDEIIIGRNGLLGTNSMTGQGKATYVNGNVYEGDFEYGICTGNGKLTFVNGDVYEGEFAKNQATGKGLFTLANGTKYIGLFKDGVPNGDVEVISKDGEVMYSGVFADGIAKDNKYDFPYTTITLNANPDCSHETEWMMIFLREKIAYLLGF